MEFDELEEDGVLEFLGEIGDAGLEGGEGLVLGEGVRDCVTLYLKGEGWDIYCLLLFGSKCTF